MRRISLLVVTLFALALTSAYAADVKLDGIKCIVAGKNDAKADKTEED